MTSGGHKIRHFANASIEQQLLESVRDDRQHAAYIDLCIGSRVKCTENLLIPVGLCNGSQGTVVGFLFSKPQRADFVYFPEFKHLAQDSADREIPIVLVQFDFKEDDPVALEHAKRYGEDNEISTNACKFLEMTPNSKLACFKFEAFPKTTECITCCAAFKKKILADQHHDINGSVIFVVHC